MEVEKPLSVWLTTIAIITAGLIFIVIFNWLMSATLTEAIISKSGFIKEK